MSKSEKCIIFDLDGTLIDSRQDLAAAVNMMLCDLGIAPIPFDTAVSYLGNGARRLVERAVGGSCTALDKAVTLFKEHYQRRMLDKTVLYPDVLEGLSMLRSMNWKLALITNKPETHSREILRHFNLEQYFPVLIGGDGGFPLKPGPASAGFILERTYSKPENSWIVGDNYTDMSCGRKCGLKRCFARYGFGNLRDESFDIEIFSFYELCDFLKNRDF